MLSEQEQVCLIHAIDSATDTHRADQFQAWINGPFRILLPHETMVCVEMNEQGGVRHVDCLQHHLSDAAVTEYLCHPTQGLAVRLAKKYGSSVESLHVISDDGVSGQSSAGPDFSDFKRIKNVVVYSIRFLSGDRYFLVLVNVSADSIGRSGRVFKILAPHLKMVLARAIAAREPPARVTHREMEVLHWMREGKSNREISSILGISAMTLKNHISKLYRKLDVQSRTEAVSKGNLLVQAQKPSRIGV